MRLIRHRYRDSTSRVKEMRNIENELDTIIRTENEEEEEKKKERDRKTRECETENET